MARKRPPYPPLLVQQQLYDIIFSEFDSVNAWANKYKLTQTTINRIIKGADPSTTMLQTIADAMTANGRPIKAWQFLAPNLGEGLHEVEITNAGETRVVPILRSADKAGHGQRGIDSWDKQRNPGRRDSDPKTGES